jgi:hypothetical protein
MTYIHLGRTTVWLPIVTCDLVCSPAGWWLILVRTRGDLYRRVLYTTGDYDRALVVQAAIGNVIEAHRQNDPIALAAAKAAMRARAHP